MNFKEELKNLNIILSDEDLDKFNTYYHYLIEYNKFVNLTAIVEYDEVMIKHFYDSLILQTALKNGVRLCDVGAGAGFPSVPCAIVRPDIDVTIIDALNKRIVFLNELTHKLKLNNVKALHTRAEDHAKDYREYYDVVTARAVARLNILSELTLPLVKVGGVFIAMKAIESEEEINEAKNAIKILGGQIIERRNFVLPLGYGDRELIIIKKIKETPKKYPRAFSVIKNKAL